MKKIITFVTCFTFFFQIAIFPAMAQESASNYTPTKEDVLKVLNESLMDINKSTDEELAASIKSSIEVTEKLEETGKISAVEATKMKESYSALLNNPAKKELTKNALKKAINEVQTLGVGELLSSMLSAILGLGLFVGGLYAISKPGKEFKIIGLVLMGFGGYLALTSAAQAIESLKMLPDAFNTAP